MSARLVRRVCVLMMMLGVVLTSTLLATGCAGSDLVETYRAAETVKRVGDFEQTLRVAALSPGVREVTSPRNFQVWRLRTYDLDGEVIGSGRSSVKLVEIIPPDQED